MKSCHGRPLNYRKLLTMGSVQESRQFLHRPIRNSRMRANRRTAAPRSSGLLPGLRPYSPDSRSARISSLGITAHEVGGQIALELPQRLFHSSSAAFKRVIDLSLCGVALILFSPLLLIIALAIKLTSNGPILYGHGRYGKEGDFFRALKFRTMHRM